MSNVDLTKQILVKVSEDLDKAIEQACVEHRKRTGENITKPEKVREIVYSDLVVRGLNIKEEFQKESLKIRLGKLPSFVIEKCCSEVKKGNLSCSIYLDTKDLLFLLGDFYTQNAKKYSLFDDSGYITHDFHQYDPFIEQIASELQTVIKMNVKITNMFFKVLLEINWDK